MKKPISALVALSLVCALAAPALAAEGADWRKTKEEFTGEYIAQWQMDHPEEWTAFDADAYFEDVYGEWNTKEEYMAGSEPDEEAFRVKMWLDGRKEEIDRAYNRYVTQAYEAVFPGDIDQVGLPWALMIFGWESLEAYAAEIFEGDTETARLYLASSYVSCRQGAAYDHEATLKYREQYPGSWENYDPYAEYTPGWEYLIDIYMARYGLQNEEEFKEWRYVYYMEEGQYAREQEQAAKRDEYPTRWPEEYAAFDPEAWFAGYYSLLSLTPEAYMAREGLDAEGFKRAMFVEWADKGPTSFFNGYCVMVDGTPIQFQFYRDLDGEVVGPKVENDRILIPLRAAAEALALTVEWKPETNQVICANDQTTVTFTLDSTQYSGGVLDAAPFADNGVTYLPLRALGEALGCGVTWLPDFATAALTTEN